MFTFFTRITTRLLLFTLIGCAVWVGVARLAQTDFPPILYGNTSTLQLYKTDVSCTTFWLGCDRNRRFLLDSLYSFPVANWSPDGDYISVHMSERWLVYPTECLLVLQTCQPVELREAVGDVRVAWGPDGTTLAAYTNARNVTTTIHTRGCWDGISPCLQKTIVISESSLLTEPAWSADGSRMAFADYLQTGLIWFDTACFDKVEGCAADLHSVNIGANRVSWPSLSADGRTAILTMDTRGDNSQQQIFKVDLESGAVQQLTDRVGTATFPDWSADGRYILFAGFPKAHSGDLQIYLMDLERHITLPLVQQRGDDLAFASWGH